MTVGERIRMLRKEKHLTLEEVSEHIGVGKATVSKYETGQIKDIPSEKMHKLANFLGVTRPYLEGWTEERRANPAENLDRVAEQLRAPFDEIFSEDTGYWRKRGYKLSDCTTAATQAARALVKFGISRTPIYPQQILQASKYATMISFADPAELDEIVATNVVTSRTEKNDLVMASIYMDENKQSHYLFSVNRNAPMGHLKLALAVELGHIYLGHVSHLNQSPKMEMEAECFAVHLEFPRPLIRLLQERGFVLTKESFSRIFGDCEWCLDSILNAEPVTISSELNRLVKEQFVPYVDTLEDIGIFQIPSRGEELDLSRYMAGYEE